MGCCGGLSPRRRDGAVAGLDPQLGCVVTWGRWVPGAHQGKPLTAVRGRLGQGPMAPGVHPGPRAGTGSEQGQCISPSLIWAHQGSRGEHWLESPWGGRWGCPGKRPIAGGWGGGLADLGVQSLAGFGFTVNLVHFVANATRLTPRGLGEGILQGPLGSWALTQAPPTPVPGPPGSV